MGDEPTPGAPPPFALTPSVSLRIRVSLSLSPFLPATLCCAVLRCATLCCAAPVGACLAPQVLLSEAETSPIANSLRRGLRGGASAHLADTDIYRAIRARHGTVALSVPLDTIAKLFNQVRATLLQSRGRRC